MTVEDEEILQSYIEESLEHLASIETDLLAIENGGANVDNELVNKVFRAAHSIKGGSAFLGFNNIKELSHKMENILGLIRDGSIVPTPEIVNILLLASDALRNMVNNAAESDQIDVSNHIEALSGICGDSHSNIANLSSSNEISKDTLSKMFEIPVSEASETEITTESVSEDSSLLNKKDDEEDKRGKTDSSLRVNVKLLDSLMNLAGELVLSRNQLLQAIPLRDFHAVEVASQHINHITSGLQEAIMATRMQQIGSVFNKFPRVVRDLAKSLGKELNLIIEGKDVELDKTIIEAINDPLTHLIRNSVDHGIESPEERKKAGKKSAGTISLKAYHEAGYVNIEISDDGKGMDGNKLAKTAVAKGLISEKQASMMSDKEKGNLIFLPGFSTAEKVTDVSGRGVGMDVVRTNLDRLGGIIDIETKVGQGTRIRTKLPLTLAIIASQIVAVEGERYAIPQVNLDELLRIPSDQVKDRLEKVGNADVVRLRGDLLPLVRLSDVLGVEKTYVDPNYEDQLGISHDRRENIVDRRSKKSALLEDEFLKVEQATTIQEELQEFTAGSRKNHDRRYHAQSAINIVVVSTGDMKFGLIVDKLYDSEEIVVKPLGSHLKDCQGYAGATIMGDGRVALILDVAGLSKLAGLMSMEGNSLEKALSKALSKDKASKHQKDVQSLLVFMNADQEQFAVPLSLVERIEKIKTTSIEEVGGRRVVKYRGGTLPLFAIEEIAKVKPLAIKQDVVVIVFTLVGKEVGILANQPLDAIEESIEFDDSTFKQPGIMGSAIVRGYTTLMVDIFGLVESLYPDWFGDRSPVATTDGSAATILLAEDSSFFRNQLKGFLTDSGYSVITAEDGQVAWNLLAENSDSVSLIVTDIEMPNMNGFDLTTRVRQSERFSHLPVIAVTSLAGEEDVQRGKAVGINDYQIKLDREKLLDSIHNYLVSAQK
ncbi:MAG: chemotaxis protein CheW [Pseudomonadota bacterium]